MPLSELCHNKCACRETGRPLCQSKACAVNSLSVYELGFSIVTLFTMKNMRRLGSKSTASVVLSTCMAQWDEITSRQSHQSCCVYNENVIVFICYFPFSVLLLKNTPATVLNFLISFKTMRQHCYVTQNLLYTVTNTTISIKREGVRE